MQNGQSMRSEALKPDNFDENKEIKRQLWLQQSVYKNNQYYMKELAVSDRRSVHSRINID